MGSTIKGKIKRMVKVQGVPVPVIVQITETGIEMSLKGFRTKVFAPWNRIADAMVTPATVPSYLMGRPLEFLKHQAAKLQRKEDGL